MGWTAVALDLGSTFARGHALRSLRENQGYERTLTAMPNYWGWRAGILTADIVNSSYLL